MTEPGGGGDGENNAYHGATTEDHPFRGRVTVYQPAKGFRYSVDAFILIDFASHPISNSEPLSIDAAEFGSGTGIVAMGLALYDSVGHITGLEITEELAQMGRRGVVASGLSEKVTLLTGDYKNPTASGLKPDFYDLVVSNPPYRPVGKGRVSPDMSRAVARHEIAANLEDLVRAAARILKSNGSFCVIYVPERLPELFEKLKQYRLEPRRMRFVHPDRETPARMVLVEAKKSSAKGLEISPPLYVQDEKGNYTEEMGKAFEGPK